MAVTIGTLNSKLDVSDATHPPDAQSVEQIVALVMKRLKEEQRHEKQLEEQGEIPDRMSEPTTH